LYARLRGDVEQLTVSALNRSGASGDSKSPTHIAELGTDNYEQDFSLRFVENEQETIEEIKAAIQRIDDGTYGLCEMCSEEGKSRTRSQISRRRLRAIPHVRNCIECERKREELYS
jgi:DnaK suppressor protein